jgi:hypothetical protein
VRNVCGRNSCASRARKFIQISHQPFCAGPLLKNVRALALVVCISNLFTLGGLRNVHDGCNFCTHALGHAEISTS